MKFFKNKINRYGIFLFSFFLFLMGEALINPQLETFANNHYELMPKESKIYVAGHKGLVGSALVRQLNAQGYYNLITRTSNELDLRDKRAVNKFFEQERPEFVFLAAAKVGGIKANSDYPVDFLCDNLAIELNVINAAYEYDVKKLIFLGSSCIYPRDCPQPIKEEYLLTGPLEKTNEPYALAKIAGLELCKSYNRQHLTTFISCMPTNLYGPEDNFDKQTSHVMPALIAKIYEAQQKGLPSVEVWGDGTPRREFLYVDDLAQAVIFLMKNYNEDMHINIGIGEDISIGELAVMIKEIVGYKGEIIFNKSMPNGTPRKLLDVSRLHALGWNHTNSLYDGVRKTVAWYCDHKCATTNLRSSSTARIELESAMIKRS